MPCSAPRRRRRPCSTTRAVGLQSSRQSAFAPRWSSLGRSIPSFSVSCCSHPRHLTLYASPDPPRLSSSLPHHQHLQAGARCYRHGVARGQRHHRRALLRQRHRERRFARECGCRVSGGRDPCLRHQGRGCPRPSGLTTRSSERASAAGSVPSSSLDFAAARR